MAATSSSTFFGSTSTSAQVDLLAENEKPGQHEANLRQVAHEHRRQIDHERALRAHGANRQAEQHAVGVSDLHGLFGRAAFVGGEPHVAPHELNVLARFAELPNGIVAEAPTEAAQESASGRCRGRS